MVDQSNRGACGPHAMQFRILIGVFPDAIVRGLKTIQQPGTGAAGNRVGIELLDNFDSDTTGFLATFVSAHPICHHG